MGMSASQVRLLTVTKRIHEVENEAQRIQNQKMLLGLQSDEAYEEYLAAMEKKDIQYARFNSATGNFDWDDLTINKLFNQGYRMKVKVPGQVVQHDNPIYQPRTIQISAQQLNDSMTSTANIYANITTTTTDDSLNVQYNGSTIGVIANETSLMDGQTYVITDADGHMGTALYEESSATDNTLQVTIPTYSISAEGISNSLIFVGNGSPLTYTDSEGDDSTVYRLTRNTDGSATISYQELVGYQTSYTTTSEVWRDCATPAEVLAALTEIGQANHTLPSGQMVPSSVADNTTTLRDLIYNAYAIITAEIYNPDTQSLDYQETSVATNTGLRENSNKEELAKAEAEYEAALRRIDKKEEQYDKDLAKMDQERKALTTELDTFKTCIKENIDRTFKIFS